MRLRRGAAKTEPLKWTMKVCTASVRRASTPSFLPSACPSACLASQISNFDYLMLLNTLAGRTTNDVTQVWPLWGVEKG